LSGGHDMSNKIKFGLIVLFSVSLIQTLSAQDPFSYDGDLYGGGYTNGIAWGDYNNDGFEDFFISNGHQSATNEQNENHLFLNNGNGTFTMQSSTAGPLVSDQFVSGGTTWGDYDNDGDLDNFVAEIYRVPVSFPQTYTTDYSLFLNDADGTFSRTDNHGDLSVNTEQCGVFGTWVDMNNDGFLDLALSTLFIKFQPGTNNNALFLNNHDGTFSKQSNSFTDRSTQQGSLSCVDYDDDGDQDIISVAGNDQQATVVYENTGSDFNPTILIQGEDAKGTSWGDYDNDGDFDAIITISGVNLDSGVPVAQKNILYNNDGGSFSVVAAGELTTDTLYSYASAWGDYDNDGDLDIFIGNSGGHSTPQQSYIYINNGMGNFTKLASTVLSDSGTAVRVAAWSDYDNDGDLDMAVGRDGKNRLFTNELSNGNHYLNIKLTGVTANRSGIGSIIKLKATINGEPTWLLRDVNGQTGYGSQNSLRVHFGLGDATVVDSIIIDWAGSSTIDVFTDVPVDQFMQVTEDETSAIDEGPINGPTGFRLDQNYPNPFNPTTTISYQLAMPGNVELSVFNAIGQNVGQLIQAEQSAGSYSILFDASELPSGIYFYKLSSGTSVDIRKMILMQ